MILIEYVDKSQVIFHEIKMAAAGLDGKYHVLIEGDELREITKRCWKRLVRDQT